MSRSQCYVVVSRSRENNWDKPSLDDIIIDSLCQYCKILIHGHFELKSSNNQPGACVLIVGVLENAPKQSTNGVEVRACVLANGGI